MGIEKRSGDFEPTHSMETIVACGSGADAYKVIINYILLRRELRHALNDKNQPDFKGKEGEALVSAIVARVAKDSPVVIYRTKNGVKSDGPNGEPAHQLINNGQLALENHAQNGVVTDGVNGEAAAQVYEKGLLKRAVHYTNGAVTMMKQFTYTDATFTEKFNAAAAPKEWKLCNVAVEYRNADHLTIDAPDGAPGLQHWQMGYALVDGQPSELKFSQQANLTFAMHYKDGKMGAEANAAEKQRLPKQWPTI